MCVHCDEIMKCPVGEKRTVQLSDQDDLPLMKITKDRYPHFSNVTIGSSYIDDDGGWHNTTFRIKYCPFCGEDLLKED